MHDDQHIVRLFLLDRGIHQGYLFPRWVDGLGFGFGYPLFNFYPPLIYYVSEFFHLIGFSYIWSIKLMIILGFILAAVGSYSLIKQLLGKWPALLGATIYTYFFYHSVNVYVRGALAEFFAMAVLPFVFLFLHRLFLKLDLRNSLFFGISLAVLILTHPLIALPSVFFIGFTFLFYLLIVKNKTKLIYLFVIGSFVGLGLSSFFWLPSLSEKNFTLADKILTTEQADYKKHFVCPYQFWYSAWGYGGSGENCQSGLTFQLGKIPIALFGVSLLLFLNFFHRKKKIDLSTSYYLLTTFLLLFSLFMATSYSSFIWGAISYMAYLQWPWRFLTFTALFISIAGSYLISFLKILFKSFTSNKKLMSLIVFLLCIIIIVKYQQYFRPQRLIATNDADRTSFEEVAWRVSGTSYEFVPVGVATKKTQYGTTTLAISENELPRIPYQIVSGKALVSVEKNNFSQKKFNINAVYPTIFQLNTYNFPGWQAFIDKKQVIISDDNKFKLITILVAPGEHKLLFTFTNTPIRSFASYISLFSLLFVSLLFIFKPLRELVGRDK